jgi:hypothetical protein
MEYLPSLQQEFDEHKPSLFGQSSSLPFLAGEMESPLGIQGTSILSWRHGKDFQMLTNRLLLARTPR